MLKKDKEKFDDLLKELIREKSSSAWLSGEEKASKRVEALRAEIKALKEGSLTVRERIDARARDEEEPVREVSR